MAIGIQNYPNVDTSNPTAYPNGIIKDNPGNGTGTKINKLTNGDIHAFFDKLLRNASITANNTPDNETNGYQYIQALYSLPAWVAVTSIHNHWINEGSGTFNDFQYLIDRFGIVHLRGCIKRNDSSSGQASEIVVLPSLIRPTKQMSFPACAGTNSYGFGGLQITISTTGSVVPYENKGDTGLLTTLNAAGDYVSLDGISYAL